MKHNPFIKEAAEHREVRCTEQEGGPGRWEEDLTAEEVSPGLACHGGQLPCAAPPPRSNCFALKQTRQGVKRHNGRPSQAKLQTYARL